MSEPDSTPVWDDPEWDADKELDGEVPDILQSEYSGLPFSTCLVCSRKLIDVEMHVVEKVIKNRETVMEMALCGPCCENMTNEVSKESLETLRSVQEKWMNQGDDAGELCAGCEQTRDYSGAFVIAGYFLPGYHLVRSMAVCEKCHEGVQDKLSKKTREVFGDFVGTHFPGVPEDIDSPVFFS